MKFTQLKWRTRDFCFSLCHFIELKLNSNNKISMFARFCGVYQRLKHILNWETAFSLVAVADSAAFLLVDDVFAYNFAQGASFASLLFVSKIVFACDRGWIGADTSASQFAVCHVQ
jgi:hypothetical protein